MEKRVIHNPIVPHLGVMAPRFWRAVIKDADPNKCWGWSLSCNEHGYGQIGISLKARNMMFKAPRVSWAIHFGEIPGRLFVCHKCDNPICANPTHLFLGTQKENMSDASAKGRVRNQLSDMTHCLKGHAFAGYNEVRNKNGTRYCRECRNIWQRNRRAAARQIAAGQ